MEGRVVGLHVKPATPGERGLPKRPVERVRIAAAGVEGDFNVWRAGRDDGDPTSAVLLFPRETLGELRAEGWALAPGDLGENVLTEGVPYAATPPGTRVEVGDALLEVTRPCDPCRNLRLLPAVGEARIPEFLKATLGRRGWYARVLREGDVRVGDAVRLVA